MAGLLRLCAPRHTARPERGASAAASTFRRVGGRLIRPGDLVIGDDDGLVALSPETVRGRIGDAEGKLAREAGWEAALADGKSLAQALGVAAAVEAG